MSYFLSILSHRKRFMLLLAGLFLVSIGIFLTASASQTTLIVTEGELNRYWRTSYDLLIRPAGSRSPIEEKYGLVEANHLSGLWGGITFEQYEAVKSIPDVEVAAPIAMIGYIVGGAGGEMLYPPQPGLYALDQTITVNDGINLYTPPGYPARLYYYFDRNPQQPPEGFEGYRFLGWLLINDPSTGTAGGISFPLLLAGIDPKQEALLTGLDQALLAGQYLRGDESLEPNLTIDIVPGLDVPQVKLPPKQMSLPILINATTYIDATNQATLSRVILPPDIDSAQKIIDRGASYLNTLPTETINKVQMDSQALYRQMIEIIAPKFVGSYQWGGTFLNQGVFESPGRPVYHESTAPFAHNELILELQPPSPINSTWPQYRASTGSVDFNVLFEWNPIGMFDIERLSHPTEVNSVPLETYFPPTALLRYDEQGQPVDPPIQLRPTLNPAGYIQSPPMILTTLEATHALRGENSISAIRIRVANIDRLTPQGQRKIEAIAIEIQRRTGLDVDIMVGSSPTRVLVHVPGVGYVEEQWIQKGVNLTYKQGIQSGNWLLLGTLLLAGGLFTLDLTWAEVLSRRRVVALQKALGWRSLSVFAQVVRQVMMIGAIATVAGTLIAMALIRWLKWEAIPSNLLIALPLLVIGLCGIGSLIPAWSASRVSPIVELQRGGVRYQRKRTNPVLGLWMYAWSEIKRRTVRSILTGLGSALSAGLLTLLLGVTLQQRGMLNGTLLGEFILVNVEGYHYAIVGIGLGLAFLSTFNGLLGSILERRREIGVLKAVGWRTASVARLFIAQGIILGIVGGSFGVLAGALTFLYLYQSISADMVVAILLGISLSALVGALAALYPSRLAAKVPPAEAVRYE